MSTSRASSGLFALVLVLLAATSLGFSSPSDAARADVGNWDEWPPAAPPALLTCLDTHEPNDNVIQAREISLTSYMAYRYGNVYSYLCQGDVIDVWKFYVTAGDRIQLDLSSLPANYDLRLWDSIPTQHAASYNYGTSSEQIIHTAQTTGWWYAVVDPGSTADFDGSDSYHLEVRTYYATPTPTPTPTSTPTASPTCLDTHEPNDGFYSAREISLTTYAAYRYGYVYSYICYGDPGDYWSFYVLTGEEIQLDLSSLPANYNLTLWDPNGTARSWSFTYGTDPEQIIYTAASTGLWRAEVKGNTYLEYSNDDSYHLEVRISYAADTATPTATLTPTRTATPACPDPYEPNDTFATAIEIPMTTYIAYRYGHVYSYNCVGDSYDYWKFYVNAGEVIRLTLTRQGPYRSFDVLLYDPSNSFVTGRSGEPIDFDYPAHVTGWWRARVSTWVASDQDTYHLEVRVYTAWDTVTPTHTATRTPTRTPTKTPTPTLTRTRTPTATATLTSRPVNTVGPSPTWVAGARKRLWLPMLFTQ